jgi:PmbA protein
VSVTGPDLMDIATRSVEHLKKKGARESAVVVARGRSVECQIREKKVEQLQESAAASMSVAVYADDRFSAHSTNDLRWSEVEPFLDQALAMTKVLEPDPFRRLPDPKLYENRPTVDLAMLDADYSKVETSQRKKFARDVEDAALAKGKDLASVTTSFGDGWGESIRVTSNGFHGREEYTSFSAFAEVTVKDGEKRPEDYWYVAGRRFAELTDPAALGRKAVERAEARIGARKVTGGSMPVVVENRTAGRLLGFLLAATTAGALQQKRSFLDGKLGQRVTSAKLTVVDDPLIPGALGSRHFDGEGISAKRMPVLEAGVLKTYFVDTYYGRKLGMEPTTGGWSNLVITPGSKDLQALAATMKRGILITSFLGGNSNSLTGDFSVGIQGHLVESGEIVHPIAEMNLSGNHVEFWEHLADVGSDPWLVSSVRIPSLLFEGVSVSGA